MGVLGVDLAATSSAAVELRQDGYIGDEFDSIDLGNALFVQNILSYGGPVYVEDIPPIGRFDKNAKLVCRLQGKLEDHVEFVPPRIWMNYHGYHGRAHSGTTKAYAKLVCGQYGYKPPEGIHGKLLTDYRDAFLIAIYGWEKEYGRKASGSHSGDSEEA